MDRAHTPRENTFVLESMHEQKSFEELQVSSLISDEELVNRRIDNACSVNGFESFFNNKKLHKNIDKKDYTIWRRFCSNLNSFQSLFHVGPRCKTEMQAEPSYLHRTNTK